MKNKQTQTLIFSLGVSILLFTLAFSANAAFFGPPAGSNPPTGGGLFSVNPERNIGFGGEGATPTNTLDGTAIERVFMVTANNNPGLGLRNANITTNKRFILTARNNGQLALLDDSANAIRFYVDTNGDFVVGGTGSLRATNLLGTVQATQVASGVFGSLTGGGNFAFPSALGVGTNSTGLAPTNGLYVAGQVKIAGGTPGAGKVLTSSDDAGLGTWQALPSPPVTSVFGRLGAVTANANDYSVSQITGAAPLASPIFTGNVTMPGTGIWNSSGQVGIGITNPVQKLEVVGEIKTKSPLTTSDGIQIGIEGSERPRVGFHVSDNNRRFKIELNTINTANERLGIFSNCGGGCLETEWLTINKTGNVGIGTTNPGYKLDVAGSASFTGPVFVPPPAAALHAATKEYVDNVVSGSSAGFVNANECTRDATCEMKGANLLGGNIAGVNRLDVTKIYAGTIDPIYTIGGISYATYVSDTIGLKTEIYGKAKLEKDSGYEYTIDFNNVEKGSDLWLFWQTIDEGKDMEDVVVNLTPNFPGQVWYELHPEERQIVINAVPSQMSNVNGQLFEVSYHLVAPRHDAKTWPQILDNPTNKGTTLEIRN